MPNTDAMRLMFVSDSVTQDETGKHRYCSTRVEDENKKTVTGAGFAGAIGGRARQPDRTSIARQPHRVVVAPVELQRVQVKAEGQTDDQDDDGHLDALHGTCTIRDAPRDQVAG